MSTKIEISKVQMSPRSPTPLNTQPAEFQVRSGAPAEPADYLPVMGGGTSDSLITSFVPTEANSHPNNYPTAN